MHLSLLILSGSIDYFIGKSLFKRQNGWFLALSIGLNLSILCFFKYSSFIFELDSFSLFERDVLIAGIPIGVSFYTFQSMSYSIDIYRKTLRPANNIFHFFSYLSFFPQLVAGPICRGEELLGQLEEIGSKKTDMYEILRFLFIGYFQKVFLADQIGELVDMAYAANTFKESFHHWWLVHLGFGMQIYFDFCGYSNIARGLGSLFGIKLPPNFDFPYFANSLRDFWRRWHMTLSKWFRDYVYIPMGGNKKTIVNGCLAVFVTFLLSGIWHGSSSNFLLWGSFIGAMMIIEKSFLGFLHEGKLPILGKVWTITIITSGWAMFRCTDIVTLRKIIFCMVSPFTGDKFYLNNLLKQIMMILVIGIVFEMILYVLEKTKVKIRLNLEMALFSLLIPITIFFRLGSEAFLYFRF